MAEVILRVTLPDDHDRILDYGTPDFAAELLEYIHGCYMVPECHYEVASWSGPNEPRACTDCGEFPCICITEDSD